MAHMVITNHTALQAHRSCAAIIRVAGASEPSNVPFLEPYAMCRMIVYRLYRTDMCSNVYIKVYAEKMWSILTC